METPSYYGVLTTPYVRRREETSLVSPSRVIFSPLWAFVLPHTRTVLLFLNCPKRGNTARPLASPRFLAPTPPAIAWPRRSPNYTEYLRYHASSVFPLWLQSAGMEWRLPCGDEYSKPKEPISRKGGWNPNLVAAFHIRSHVDSTEYAQAITSLLFVFSFSSSPFLQPQVTTPINTSLPPNPLWGSQTSRSHDRVERAAGGEAACKVL